MIKLKFDGDDDDDDESERSEHIILIIIYLLFTTKRMGMYTVSVIHNSTHLLHTVQ